MRKLASTLVLALALIAPAPALAGSGPGASAPAGPAGAVGAMAAAGTDVALPYAAPASLATPPPGFATTAIQAERAAEATAKMQSLHRRLHPLLVQPFVASDRSWAVFFSYRGRIVAEVDVDPAGSVTHVYTGPIAAAGYARGHYAPVFDSWWVVVPFSLLFLVPFLDLRRPWRLVHLDALVLLSFLLSYWLFDHSHLEPAVWMAYPPLLYLGVRMALLGLRGPGASAPARALRVPTRLLAAGLLGLLAARIALSLIDTKVIDVGYASVIGAHRILHGQALYYASLAHPDTYGPVAYLAYVPFELLFGWHGHWDYLPAAHAASLCFDLVTVAGLLALGPRLRRGPEGRRLGLALAWAWAACPFTLLGLMEHSNDGLVAMLAVLGLLVFSSPGARGAVLGLAAAAKFSPAALLPLFAGQRGSGRRGPPACVAAFAAVAATAVAAYLPPGGLAEIYDHTIGFQLTRTDVFSPWALHPSLAPVKLLLALGAVAFAASLAFSRRPRTLVQVSALAAAVTVAVQLPAVHWFYYYIVWFVPFVLVALLASEPEPARAQPEPVQLRDALARASVRDLESLGV